MCIAGMSAQCANTLGDRCQAAENLANVGRYLGRKIGFAGRQAQWFLNGTDQAVSKSSSIVFSTIAATMARYFSIVCLCHSIFARQRLAAAL
jgi:hypothetical protein